MTHVQAAHRYKSLRLLACFLGALGAQGCGAVDGETEGGEGAPSASSEIGESRHALSPTPWGTTMSFNENTNTDPLMIGDRTMFTTDTVCVMSRVSGAFRSPGDYALLKNDQGIFWVETGPSQRMSITCYPTDAFVAPGPERWVSEPFVAVMAKESGCRTASTLAWWGDAATFLLGMSGNFRGGGESVRTLQSAGASTNSRVQLSACQPGRDAVWAFGGSFFAGAPNTNNLVDLRFSGNGVQLENLASDPVSKETQLAPTADAMCYLTYVGGQFDGLGEEAKVYSKPGSGGINHWFLRIQSGAGLSRKYITAKANCMMRRQF